MTAQQTHHRFLILAHHQTPNVPVQFVVHSLVCEQTLANNASSHLITWQMSISKSKASTDIDVSTAV
jgi:hypothetical protein